IFARAQVTFAKTDVPEILRSFFAMAIVSIPPEPCCQRFVLVGDRRFSSDPLILFRFRPEEPLESRTGQLARIPGIIRADLWISDVCLSLRPAHQPNQRQCKEASG